MAHGMSVCILSLGHFTMSGTRLTNQRSLERMACYVSYAGTTVIVP